MRQVNLLSIYMLGGGIHPLPDIPVGTRGIDVIKAFTPTNWLLMHLIEGQPIPLTRCIAFAKILQNVLTEIVDRLKSDPANVLSRDDHQKLEYAVNAFEQKFSHEIDHFEVFYIPPKGTHATIKLMEHAENDLPPDVRARLSPETIRDIQDAGKCLALDCHTASGYHILRAVERVIIKYVEKVTGKAYGVKNRNWGAYIKVLAVNQADARMIGYLDYIRQFYRNPIIHPEDTLDSNEAFSLFTASLSALIQLDAAIEAWP